ncbi:MAG: TlyA family RNA methyltransferase [Lachnospiraceae bacterium]|nr:TlyA family RNA methyltransferase [Lachnospiraceae bacterium]
MEEKQRLDVRLVQEGLAPSRERAKEWIQAGQVKCRGTVCKKAGTMVSVQEPLEILAAPLPYVSRGGLKLEKALTVFGIKLEQAVCLDAGASTGGFTDCMLQHGAASVYAVDVGHDQLAEKLRQDPRVTNIENTNVKHLTEEMLGEPCDFASVDVSFISLKKVLPAIVGCLKEGGQLVCLVKPQFEAGRDKIGKKGVVKEEKVHKQVLREMIAFCEEKNWAVKNVTASPIRGQEGNREFLLYLIKDTKMEKGAGEDIPTLIERAVREAHEKEA